MAGFQVSTEAQGLEFEPPRDAAWGERFFHITEPDGHELGFAELLPVGGWRLI
jgi:uncharacterized GH25 family protein